MNEQRKFDYVVMTLKGIKWFFRVAVAMGLVCHFGLKMGNILDLVLSSSVAVGFLTAAQNFAKHKLGWKWVP